MCKVVFPIEIEAFNEIFNMVYIAKKLFDLEKYHLVSESFFDSLEYESYYENMYGLIENLFEHYRCSYYDHRCFELHIMSDPVIVDFYILTGEYGRNKNLTDDVNPYIQEAKEEVGEQLNIGHCVDWTVMGHTNPKRPFHSRIGITISHDCGCTDLGVLAYRLIEVYEWFKHKCDELNAKLAEFRPLPGQLRLEDKSINEAIAA